MMNDNSKAIFNFLKENADKAFTAKEIAGELNLAATTVNGCVTGLTKKGLAVRTEKEVLAPSIVKCISLTDEGLDFDPASEVEADAE